MRKKRSVIRRLLPWMVFCILVVLLVVFVGIPLYAPQEQESEKPPFISYYEDGAQTISMENEHLRFEMDAQTTQFQLTEKKTGRVWNSNPADAAQDSIAVSTNKNILQSTMIVTYSSASGVIDFNNYEYSIMNGTYRIEQPSPDEVRVTYSVGKIEKIYILPQATTEERFKAYTEGMSKKNAKKVKSVYTLYKTDGIQKNENYESLLAMYPELANQNLYVLKEDTSENNKKNVSGYFAEAGYTQEDYEYDKQFVAGSAENTNPVFNVTMVYRLEGQDFLVSVPYEEMRYRAEYPITAVTVLPMFGAAGLNEEGFMLIPEGGGALIRYNNGKLNQNSYYANMYGWDYGSERTEVVSETKNTFPVFGMTQNGGSFLCMMEGAAAYGGVQADISMRYNSYNWVCAKYTVLHSDKYNVSAKTARLVYMFEKSLPQDTIVQRYRFVDSDHYADMAVAYGAYLRERYPEMAERTLQDAMPVSVELVGAIDKKVVRMGLPVNTVVATTRFQDAEAIMDDMQKAGVQNLSIRYSGWCNGGIEQKVLSRVRVLGQLGGENAMKSLISAAKDRGIPLYFDGITCFAYRSGLFDGFMAFRDAARFTTREQIMIHPYSPVYYQQDKALEPFYLVRPEYAQQKASNLINGLSRLNAEGVAFRDIGYILSGDYDPKHTVTREQVKQMNIETLQAAHDAGQRVMIKEGYDYAVPYADLVTDMDLNGIEYSIIDQSVPFYQIAIHGMVDYTGAPMNICSDWETELLRCAEYGAGLNFTFMYEDARVLQDTLYSYLYGANYRAWDSVAEEIIGRYQKDMEGLNSQRITDHRVLSADVAETIYENGVQVYVNYGMNAYESGSISVPARSYVVVRGDQ